MPRSHTGTRILTGFLLFAAALIAPARPAQAAPVKICEEVFVPPDFVRTICREVSDCSNATTFREKEACRELCSDPAVKFEPMCRAYREPDCEPDERPVGDRCEPLRCRPGEKAFEGKCIPTDMMPPPPPPPPPIPPTLVSPTAGALRGCDNHGCGNFGATRRKTSGERRPHEGLDIVSSAGQNVAAPVAGVLTREIKRVSPTDTRSRGLVVKTDSGFAVVLLYVSVDRKLIGTRVVPGQIVATAQDMTFKGPAVGKAPAIPNHVHLEVRDLKIPDRRKQPINPKPLLRGLPR